jgi:hypothetical protein
MQIEVEEYIKKKMESAMKWWKRAYKANEQGNMLSEANCYAEAMQLYYECASDLIDGTGFKEVKGVNDEQ